MKTLSAAVILALAAATSSAYAEEPPSPTELAPERPLSRFAFGMGLYSFKPYLADVTFAGEGNPKTGGPRQTFDHRGRDFGVNRPGILAVEGRLDYLGRHFEVGIHMLGGGHIGGRDHATDPNAAAVADGSSVQTLGGGMHFAVVAMFARVFTFSAGADFGIRSYSANLVGDRKKTCTARYGSYPCFETADATDRYVQPRVALGWNTAARDEHPKGGLALTVWAAPDFAYGISFAFGFGVALAMPHARLR